MILETQARISRDIIVMDVLVYVLILFTGHMDKLKTSERFILRDENALLNI